MNLFILGKNTFLCSRLCSKYYEKEALMHDSVFGPILAALLGE